MEADPEDALALLQSASLGGVVAVGPRAGCRVRRTQRLGGRERALPPRCAACAGYNLHAGVAVPARDREGLERLARYVLRPPVGKDRLERRGDRVAVRLRREWSDGTTEILVSPMELTAKLCAAIPPPREVDAVAGVGGRRAGLLGRAAASGLRERQLRLRALWGWP